MTEEERDKIAKKVSKHGLLQFRAFDEFLIKNLLENKLTFGDRKNFNDPFDCNLPIDVNNNLEEIVQYLEFVNTKKGFNLTNEVIRSKAKDYYQNKGHLEDIISSTIFDKRRFSCFTLASKKDHVKNSLFWANYANKHKGICMKFSGTIISQKVINSDSHLDFIPVEYCRDDKIPEFNYIRYRLSKKHKPDWKAIQYFMATKSEHWKTEKEIRLVFENSEAIREPYVNIPFNTTFLREVYLGCNLNIDQINKIKWIFDLPKYKHVKIFRLTTSKKQFKLIPKQIK